LARFEGHARCTQPPTEGVLQVVNAQMLECPWSFVVRNNFAR